MRTVSHDEQCNDQLSHDQVGNRAPRREGNVDRAADRAAAAPSPHPASGTLLLRTEHRAFQCEDVAQAASHRFLVYTVLVIRFAWATVGD